MRDKNQFYHLPRQVYPKHSDGLLQAYLNVTETPHGYLLDLSQDTDDSLRFRTCIFPDESPPVIYVDIGDETHKANYHILHVLKSSETKLRKDIISNCEKDLVNCISECFLNILNGNIELTGCDTRKLH